MEENGQVEIGSKHSDLFKSFELPIRSLLTPCSKEEFSKVFSGFSEPERERLHRLFIQVVVSLHKDLEVGSALDALDQLVEEQSLDSLFLEKTNVMDVANNWITAKKNEMHCSMGMLEKTEDQNCLMRARVEQLKNGKQCIPRSADKQLTERKKETRSKKRCGLGPS